MFFQSIGNLDVKQWIQTWLGEVKAVTGHPGDNEYWLSERAKISSDASGCSRGIFLYTEKRSDHKRCYPKTIRL